MQQLIKIVGRLGTPSIPTLSRLLANKRDKLGMDGVLQSLSSFRVLLHLWDIFIPLYFYSIRQSRSKYPFSKRGSLLEIFAREKFMRGSGCTLFNFCFRCISNKYKFWYLVNPIPGGVCKFAHPYLDMTKRKIWGAAGSLNFLL